MAENPEATDLLGDPLRALPDKRGRRKLRFHVEVYEKVEVLAAGALTQDEIADAIGVSVPTLRKYFRRELAGALHRQKAEALSLLAEAARKGNVSAIKAYNAELDKRRAALALDERARPSASANAVRKGKKEERQDAAASVASGAGKYAPPPAPKLFN